MKRGETAQLLALQKQEVNDSAFLTRVSQLNMSLSNRHIIDRLSKDHQEHTYILESKTKKKIQPNRIRISWCVLLTCIFGISFALRFIMQRLYTKYEKHKSLLESDGSLQKILDNGELHKVLVVKKVKDLRTKYIGSIVLGLNDAIVEITGALAGLSFVFTQTTHIAAAGFITGIAASLSMAASEFLSLEHDKQGHSPSVGALYTGGAYFITVFFLVLPYMFLGNPIHALLCTLAIVLCIIAVFTFYSSVTQNTSFKRRFIQMAAVSFGVAILSFIIGGIIKFVWGVEV